MGNPVVFVEIQGRDRDTLVPFYEQLFGWPVDTSRPDGYAIVPPAGRGVGAGILAWPEGAPERVLFFVAADDPQAALDQMTANGGGVAVPPMVVADGPVVAIGTDPDGNLVGVVGTGGTPPPGGEAGAPVVHFEVNPVDADRSVAFYRDVFRWRISEIPEIAYAIVDTDAGGAGIQGGIALRSGEGPGTTFYVEVPDPAAALRRAEELGGRTVRPVTVVPGAAELAL
ncbi:MAG TPA: VOC family protein, partial [Acidimicrobiales bacterium]